MKRRTCGRDLTLSVRMGLTSLLLLSLYVGVLAFPLWLFHHEILPAKFAFGFDGIVLILLLSQYVSLDRVALRAARARIVAASDEPGLHAVLERLAGLADVPKPRVALIESGIPNAFAAGRNPERSTVAVTRGLIDRLEPGELEAVLAHEMSHIANRDGAVMTLASFPALTLREAIRSAPWKMWVFGFPLMVLACALYAVSLGIMLTISRCREFTADRGAVLLTGAPEKLMSALQKIAGSISAIPSTDLRSISQMSALFILPTNMRALTHPPLEQRLARLAAMSRDLANVEEPIRADAEASNIVAAFWAFVVVFALVVGLSLVILR